MTEAAAKFEPLIAPGPHFEPLGTPSSRQQEVQPTQPEPDALEQSKKETDPPAQKPGAENANGAMEIDRLRFEHELELGELEARLRAEFSEQIASDWREHINDAFEEIESAMLRALAPLIAEHQDRDRIAKLAAGLIEKLHNGFHQACVVEGPERLVTVLQSTCREQGLEITARATEARQVTLYIDDETFRSAVDPWQTELSALLVEK